MYRIVILLLTVLLGHSVKAQQIDDIKSEINKIKRSQSYISAEATMPDIDEAVKQAKELLVQYINEWVAEKKKSSDIKQIILSDINTYTQNIDMKRGIRTRAFVYVKKKDIVMIYGAGQIILSEDEKGSELQPLDEISEPMKIKHGDKKKGTEIKTLTETNLLKILEVETMQNLKPVFAELKSSDAIQYGVYKTAADADNCYLLLYTRTGEIKGVVEKRGLDYFTVDTHDSVDMSEYANCAAYWFMLTK